MDTIPAPLKGKVAVITGGSQGIGQAVAETFARHGVSHLAITYHTNKALAETVLSNLTSLSPTIKAVAFPANVTDPDCGETVIKQALTDLQVDHIDIVVSNAAYLEPSQAVPWKDMSKSLLDAAFAGQVWTSFALARAAEAVMPKGGRIINISSVASKANLGDMTIPYAAAKAALDSVTRNLAGVLAEKDITINTISVGATLTQTLRNTYEAIPGFQEMCESLSPTKRTASTQEVADIIAFAASPQASWWVGNSIPANGGSLLALQG